MPSDAAVLDPWRELSDAVDSIADLSQTARTVAGSVVGAWDRIGDSTAPDAARRAVAVERFEEIAAALASGSITPGHVDAVALIIPSHFRGDRLTGAIKKVAAVQGMLLASAAITTVEEFADFCRRVISRLDTDGVEPRADDDTGDDDEDGRGDIDSSGRQPSRFGLHQQPDGRWRPVGDFSADDGAALATMLEEQLVRERNRRADADEPADDRPYDERAAAALLELLLRGAGAKQPGRVGLFLHIDITDETLWAWLAGDKANVTPIFESGGQPLSYGRTRRVAPFELQRAIAHRDRTCGFPNCDSPFCRNQVHHLRHWEDGGTTDPPNMAGVCVTNHLDDHHAKGWDVRRRSDGTIDVTRPDGTPFDPTPRWQRRATSPPDAA